MQFEREFVVPLSPENVWDVLWNIEAMMKCVQGCAEAVVIEEKKRYKALIIEKVGPFKLEIPLDIEIGETVIGRSIQMRAFGKDSHIGTEVILDLVLELDRQGDQTHCRLTVDAGVVGRLASLGQGVIKLKGKQSMNHFAESLLIYLNANAVECK